MDWGNVTAEDLVDALREVDWSSPPRPLSEFFSRFTVPRSSSKWDSRFKCNLYYYRTNYFLLIVSVLILGFLRRPLAIVAALLTALSIAFLNDSFAGTFSERVTRTVRQFSPHLAAKMRPPLTPVIRGRPSSKRAIYICGRPRWVFVLIFSSASFILWFVSAGLLTVLWALAFGLLATILHASFRTPNLKARLNTFREEFRALGDQLSPSVEGLEQMPVDRPVFASGPVHVDQCSDNGTRDSCEIMQIYDDDEEDPEEYLEVVEILSSDSDV
ncbi:hypothetical protein AHAS_Ahas14G0152000 [Arachis hypogaea]